MQFIEYVRDVVDYLGDGSASLLLLGLLALAVVLVVQSLLTTMVGFSNRNQVLMALEIVGISLVVWSVPGLNDFPVLTWGIPGALALGSWWGYRSWLQVRTVQLGR